MQLRRSQLFVPGNDERKINKALGLNVDSIIFDLEDAVPPTEKGSARETLKRILGLTLGVRKELCVRINAPSSSFWRDDMKVFKDFEAICTIVAPKADKEFLIELHKEAASKQIIPLIETAKSFIHLEDIARCEGVTALGFGAGDFANSVSGVVSAYTKNIYVKTQIAVMARAYGLDPIDSVYFDLANLEGFRSEAQISKDLGFAGKQVIHPSQMNAANEIFSPSIEELERARKLIEEFEKAESRKVGAIRLNDQLVDAVHYRQAKELLERKRFIDS
ncbi:MAG: HpcH/HpaI aldolase/citrate lyase family protein [Nitrososphaerales archaeon]